MTVGLWGQRWGYGGHSGVMGATEGLWVQQGDDGSKGAQPRLSSHAAIVWYAGREDALQGMPPDL